MFAVANVCSGLRYVSARSAVLKALRRHVSEALGVQSITAAVGGDEAELAGSVLGELNEAGFGKVDGAAIRDPPPTGQTASQILHA